MLAWRSAVNSRSGMRRPQIVTFAPALASAKAIAAPMPEPPPVTSACFPDRLVIVIPCWRPPLSFGKSDRVGRVRDDRAGAMIRHGPRILPRHAASNTDRRDAAAPDRRGRRG